MLNTRCAWRYPMYGTEPAGPRFVPRYHVGTTAGGAGAPYAVVAKWLGQLVPLAAGAQAEDDAIQHLAQIHSPMPFGLGRTVFVQNRLDKQPDVIRSFLDGRLLL